MGGETKNSVGCDQTGNSTPNRYHGPGCLFDELFRARNECIHHGVGTEWSLQSGSGDHGSMTVDKDTGTLGAAHVEADTERVVDWGVADAAHSPTPMYQ